MKKLSPTMEKKVKRSPSELFHPVGRRNGFLSGNPGWNQNSFQNIYFLILIPVTPAYLAHLF